MKNITKILALAMVLFATESFAQAKFGHVNMQELVALMDEMDSAQVKLENYAKDLDETMKGMQQEMQTKYQTYQEKNATWTAAVLEAKTSELQEMQQRLQMFQQNAQQEMGQMQQKLYTPIIQKANEAVEKIGKDGGYLYIFDISAGAILYNGSQSVDIMPEARKALGIPADKKLPAPAQK